MNFEAIIGLEIHVQMKTKSKMFSASPNSFSLNPNTQTAGFDMAFPGTMPRPNKQAIINAIRIAHALHMTIDPLVRFDRKNYFYPDLPKGFQITQEFHPIGRDGYLDILDKNENTKRIHIERIHLEEDTCKSLHLSDCTLLDYNRAGVPLVEIVSQPEFRCGTEAMHYVEAIRNIVVYTHSSDGKMEEGSLRCDVNVSLRPCGSSKFGTKVEIKNINSIKHIEQAIDYEIQRQSACLLAGSRVVQDTRRFDESTGRTVSMRTKVAAVDYKPLPEPNIVPIRLSKEFIQNAIDTCPELYESKKARYLASGIPPVDVDIILSDIAMSEYLDIALSHCKSPKALANFIIVEVNAYLNKKGIGIKDFSLDPIHLAQIVDYQEEGYSHKQCVDILAYCLENACTSPADAKAALKIEKQISDDTLVLEYVTRVLDENPKSIEDFKAGKDRAFGFLVGQVMKLAQGKVNPTVVAKIMNIEIRRR